jgi:hypothetical protein
MIKAATNLVATLAAVAALNVAGYRVRHEDKAPVAVVATVSK